MSAAAAHLAQHGYCVCSGCLQPQIVANARREACELYDARRFVPGTLTRVGETVEGLQRDDHVLWLHKHVRSGHPSPPTLSALGASLTTVGMRTLDALAKLEESSRSDGHVNAGGWTRFASFDDGSTLYCAGRSDLVSARVTRACVLRARARVCVQGHTWAAAVSALFHRKVCLPLCMCEIRGCLDAQMLEMRGCLDAQMLATYEGNQAAYGKHIDCMDGDGQVAHHGRCWTLIYYLNPQWHAERDGGSLRLYLPPTDPHAGDEGSAPNELNEAVDVPPHGDTMVMMHADRVVHEVLPLLGARVAATVWFFGGTRDQYRQAVARGAIVEATRARFWSPVGGFS